MPLLLVLPAVLVVAALPAAFADTEAVNPVPSTTTLFGVQSGFDALDGAGDIEITSIGGRTYALVASWADNAVQIIDVSDPDSPVPAVSVFDGVGGFDALAGASDVDVIKTAGRTYALVASWADSAVQIIDITDPTSPRPAASVFDGAGGYDALGGASDIEVTSSSGKTYALVAGWADNAVQIIDITNPVSPSPVTSVFDSQGSFDALGGANDIEITTALGRAYALVVSIDDDAVQIIDVSNPSAPVAVASMYDGRGGFDALDGATDVEIVIASRQLYALVVSVGDDALQVIDITNPTSPRPAASVFDEQGSFDALDGPNDIEIVRISGRTYAMVASMGDDAIQIIDVTVPDAPVKATSIFDGRGGDFDALRWASDIEVTTIQGSTYAMVASMGDDAVQIIDITDPAIPVSEAAIYDGQGVFDALDGANDIEIVTIADRMYALVPGFNDDAVQIIDITDPTFPLPTASIFNDQDDFDALNGANDIEVVTIAEQVYALVAGLNDHAVQIVDITNPADPVHVASVFDGQGHYDALSRVSDIAVTTILDHTYVVAASLGDDAIQIIDITDPDSPVPVVGIFNNRDGFNALDGASDVEIVRGLIHTYAVVASAESDAVQIIDITNPRSPVPVSSVFDGRNGFDALDEASDVEVFAISGSVYALVTSSEDDALQIIDITVPAEPVAVASVFNGVGGFDALEGASDIEVIRTLGHTYAMVTAFEGDAIQVIDITDPANPIPETDAFDGRDGFSALDGASSITTITESGRTYALVTSWSDRAIQIIDITDPTTLIPEVAIFQGQKSFELYR